MSLCQIILRGQRCRGNFPAILEEEKAVTWNEFTRRISGFAKLLHDLGLQDGDRVGMLADNSHRYLEAFFATPWSGGIFVPVNSRLAVPEIEGIMSHAGVEILVADARHMSEASELKARLPQLRHLIFASDEGAPAGWIHFDTAIRKGEGMEPAPRGGDDVASIYYTSGTTGKPKGVMITHTNLIAGALAFVPTHQNNEKSICFVPAPMFHVSSISLFMPAFTVSSAVILVPRFSVETALETIKKHKATFGVVITPMMQLLLDRQAGADFDVSSMKSVSFGAGSMTEKVLKGISELFNGARLIHGYGMTETTTAVCAMDYSTAVEDDEPPARRGPTCIGRPLPGTEIGIVDADDRQLARDTVGEIVIRGPTIMKGYWEQKDLSEQTLRGGWLHTGDLGYLDKDGFVYIVDRIKDMIKTGGENVYSAEIERVIANLEGVAQCAVVGLPDPKWGEAVTAVVRMGPESRLTPELIEQHCRKNVGGYKVPRRILVGQEPFPVNSANKILKNVIKAELITELGLA